MNRALIINILLVLFWLPGLAQIKPSPKAIREATEVEKLRFGLDANQTARMEVIQTQRLTNLAAIADLKAQDYVQYLTKRRALRQYVEAATDRMLTQAQRSILEQQRQEQAARRSELLTRLKLEGADREAVNRALLELEESWE